MSGFASHFFLSFLQQFLLIAAMVAVGYMWLRRNGVSSRRRPMRIPVESRTRRHIHDGSQRSGCDLAVRVRRQQSNPLISPVSPDVSTRLRS